VSNGEDPQRVEAEFLDLEDLVTLVRRLGVGPIRDVGLLEAA
jgi:hypothetical protein